MVAGTGIAPVILAYEANVLLLDQPAMSLVPVEIFRCLAPMVVRASDYAL